MKTKLTNYRTDLIEFDSVLVEIEIINLQQSGNPETLSLQTL